MPLTGPEHYRAAERLLSRASFERSERDPSPLLDPQATALLVSRAQVHATLAATAASAEILADRYVGDGEHVNEWRNAVGRSVAADVVAAYVHDDHEPGFEESCTGCVDEVRDRETREALLVRIGTTLPQSWDLDRLKVEFIKSFGVSMERASVAELKTVLKRLVDMSWAGVGDE